jgi:hypothetical protein
LPKIKLKTIFHSISFVKLSKIFILWNCKKLKLTSIVNGSLIIIIFITDTQVIATIGAVAELIPRGAFVTREWVEFFQTSNGTTKSVGMFQKRKQKEK